jgi:hypothetical protein
LCIYLGIHSFWKDTIREVNVRMKDIVLSRVALVRTDVSEERIAFIIRVLQLVVTANVVPTLMILLTLKMEAISSSETSVLIKATRCHIQEDGSLHSHRREDLKSHLTSAVFFRSVTC